MRPLSIRLRPPVLSTHSLPDSWRAAPEPLVKEGGGQEQGGCGKVLRELSQGQEEALLVVADAECACMGVGWGKALGRSGNWEWDQRMECRVHSPGGTAVYFDLPCQLLAYSLS